MGSQFTFKCETLVKMRCETVINCRGMELSRFQAWNSRKAKLLLNQLIGSITIKNWKVGHLNIHVVLNSSKPYRCHCLCVAIDLQIIYLLCLGKTLGDKCKISVFSSKRKYESVMTLHLCMSVCCNLILFYHRLIIDIMLQCDYLLNNNFRTKNFLPVFHTHFLFKCSSSLIIPPITIKNYNATYYNDHIFRYSVPTL